MAFSAYIRNKKTKKPPRHQKKSSARFSCPHFVTYSSFFFGSFLTVTFATYPACSYAYTSQSIHYLIISRSFKTEVTTSKRSSRRTGSRCAIISRKFFIRTMDNIGEGQLLRSAVLAKKKTGAIDISKRGSSDSVRPMISY